MITNNAAPNNPVWIKAGLDRARAESEIERLQNSTFAPNSELIFINEQIDSLKKCVHSDPFQK